MPIIIEIYARRRGAVVIVFADATEDRGFESRQGIAMLFFVT
jgi:hypothetical protein